MMTLQRHDGYMVALARLHSSDLLLAEQETLKAWPGTLVDSL